MSACPKGGEHVPRFPATRTNGWIIHFCRKCGIELDRRPASRGRRAAAALFPVAAALLLAALAGLVMAAWLYAGTPV